MIGDGKRINLWCYSCQIPFFFLNNNDFSNSLMSVLICDSVLDNFHCSFSLLVSNIENTELSVINTKHKGVWRHSTNGALTHWQKLTIFCLATVKFALEQILVVVVFFHSFKIFHVDYFTYFYIYLDESSLLSFPH